MKEATKKEIVELIRRREKEYNKDVMYWKKMTEIHTGELRESAERARKRSLAGWWAMKELMNDLGIKKVW